MKTRNKKMCRARHNRIKPFRGKSKSDKENNNVSMDQSIKPQGDMPRFMIRGKINDDSSVVFDMSNLNDRQKTFVQSCQGLINDSAKKIISEGATITDANSLAFVMYHNSEDFGSGLAVGLETTADDLWNEVYEGFEPSPGLKLGRVLTRRELVQIGTESAGVLMDMLNEGGLWTWPNANAVLQRRGHTMVVVDKM